MADHMEINTAYKIPKNQWSVLRNLYKIYWPRHILGFYTLKTYIEWVKNDPMLDITIYSSDEDWQTHGTFVIVEHCGPRCNVLFNTLNADKYENLVLKAFECLPIDEAYTLTAFPGELQPVVDKYLNNLGHKSTNHCDTLLFYLPQKDALQLPREDKAGYYLNNLSLEDASLVNSLWPHRYPGSEIYLENIVKHNLTLGAYDEKTNKLCGWVVQDQVGMIGLLQVLDSHRRHGIGEHLVVHMAALLAIAGMDVIAAVLCNNRPSRHLFHKLGFKIIGRVFWYDKMPKTKIVESNTLINS